MKFDFRKIFVCLSIIFIGFMIGFYGTRLVYYYKIENKKDTKVYTISQYIKKDENIVKGNLVKDNNKYYFNGNASNNYIYYSGLMYRILSVSDDSLVIITDECITNLKFGKNEKFDESDVKKWLENIYLKNLNTEYLKNSTVSLLDIDTFHKIGEEKSFVNNDDFWVLKDNNALVVTKDGMLTKTNNYSDFLGIKPVISLNSKKKYISGDGTKENPYILENKTINTLNDTYVGQYINYNNINFRIIEKNSNGVKVVSLKPLEEKRIFSYNSNSYSLKYKNDLGYYLNNTYIENLNKNDLIRSDWYIGGYSLEYNETMNKKINAFIGILKIGDYFVSDVKNSYLLTRSNNDIYTIRENGSLYINSINNKLDVYPSFTLNNNLKINSGNGYDDNPYIVGD